ncbi:MAG: thiamine biosynthesis protein ThiF [Epulopiscium sp. Nele67-Bin001]|nr:MAG: thiamine biosynthesis protein ThiF [Epulopiscium sp. Nuni2H_MBin001]OON94073.1 MAG: thiamine biosynthesis protein ThiF [Epulopiscium sp. Nele67-Bin001]
MRIILNGRMVKTNHTTAFGFCQEGEVIILNGYQLTADYTLNEGDQVTVIKKGEFPKANELEQMLVARHTPAVYDNLKNARVAIAGAGGLGSNIAIMLARCGVGELFVVDFDIVDASNLNRQNYYIKHIGLYKTEALAEQIKEINPFIKFHYQTVKVTPKNVVDLFKGFDIVCEAFDNAYDKAMLVENLLASTDVKIVSASGMAGHTTGNTIKTHKRLSRLYVCGDLETESRVGTGLMAPRVQICAGHQANTVLRILIGEETP